MTFGSLETFFLITVLSIINLTVFSLKGTTFSNLKKERYTTPFSWNTHIHTILYTHVDSISYRQQQSPLLDAANL